MQPRRIIPPDAHAPSGRRGRKHPLRMGPQERPPVGPGARHRWVAPCIAGPGGRVRRRRGAGELRHHPLPRDDLARRQARRRIDRPQLRRRRTQLRPRHRQQHLQGDRRARTRLREFRCIRPLQRVRRLRERERRSRLPPADQRGEGSGRQGFRSTRPLRDRRVRGRRHAGGSAARQPRAQLGREHLHPERHQHHQPLRRDQAAHPRLGAARSAGAGPAGLGLGGADPRAVDGRLLPARLEEDRDRPAGHLLLDQRLRRCGRDQSLFLIR